LDIPKEVGTFKDRKGTQGAADPKKAEALQGRLDLMILKTLQALGPLHGFGIARRIEQRSRDVLEGTVYTSLLRREGER
jgi:DNA-binding PadR family transcriptional regulator